MRITILGSGTSHGIPAIDCMINGFSSERCPKGVCRDAAGGTKNRRTRCSIVVEFGEKAVLIDVSLDFRYQVLREQITRIDAVLITHAHADHIGGIPDIRSYTRATPLTFYGSAESLDRIRRSYDYVFNPPEERGGGIPQIVLEEISGPLELFGHRVVPIPVEHGSLTGAYGYRIGPLAYIPDLKRLGAGAREMLTGVECLIIDALRDTRPHPTHIILPESIALARELGAKRTYFTHLTHSIHHELDAGKLDEDQFFAFDGLVLDV